MKRNDLKATEKGDRLNQPVQKKFLDYRNRTKTGPGKIDEDIKLAREQKLMRYR
jgi:hypothetical protein